MNNDYDDEITRLKERVTALEARLGALSSAEIEQSANKKMSIREFLNLYQPKTANDHGLVLGYYIETVEGQGYFNTDDLKRAFQSAKVIPPKNLNDMVNKNISKGFMMVNAEVNSGKLSWILTNTGEKQLEEGFSKAS